MRNVNEQQSLKPSTLKAAILVLLVMLFPVEHSLAQGPPTGPAGGDLSGTYPNPVLAADRVKKTGDAMTGALNITLQGIQFNNPALKLRLDSNTAGHAAKQYFSLTNSASAEFTYAALSGAIVNGAAAAESGALRFFVANAGSLTEKAVLLNDGNFGIGTTSPLGGLHSKTSSQWSTSNYGASVIVDGARNNALALLDFTSANPWAIANVSGALTFSQMPALGNTALMPTPRVTINTSGNVGIGTTTPGYKLDVQGGQLNASGGLCIANDCKTAWSQIGGVTSVFGRTGAVVAAANDYSFSQLSGSVNLATQVTGVLPVLQGGTGVTTSTGTGSLVRNTSPTLVTPLLGVASSTSMGIGTTSTTNKLVVSGATSIGSSYTATAAPTNGLLVEGNVGIGVTSPTAKLDVAGEIRSSSGGFKFPDGTVQTTAATGSVSSGWTDGGANVSLTSTSANVGIGTTSPGSKLFVGSGTPAAGTLPGVNVALGNSSYVSASNGVVNTFVGSDVSPYGIVGTLSNHPLGLRANNALAVTIVPSGSVGIGTANPDPAYKLDVVGSVRVSGNIAAKYQDVAEWVESSQSLSAGTVVVLDHTKSNQVVASTQAYDTRVAGVISAQPGITLGEGGAAKVLVATTGRVRIKVDATRAPIQVGDLLVTGDREGFAMKSMPVNIGGVQLHRPGTLVGKALEPLAKGTGEILVLLSLQ